MIINSTNSGERSRHFPDGQVENIISWKSYVKLTIESAGKNHIPQPVYTLYAHIYL